MFKDNSACVVLATAEMQFKLRPKRISIKYHHFQDQVRNGTIVVIKGGTNENIADIFMKLLDSWQIEIPISLEPHHGMVMSILLFCPSPGILSILSHEGGILCLS